MKKSTEAERAQLEREEMRARELLRTAVPVEKSSVVAERREHLVASIERSIANVPAERRASKNRVALQSALAAAALVLLCLGGWSLVDRAEADGEARQVASNSQSLHDAFVVFEAAGADAAGAETHGNRSKSRSRENSDHAGVPRSPGDRVATRAGQLATMTFPDGTEMRTGEKTSLRLLGIGPRAQRVRVDSGVVDVTVPPPEPDRARRVVLVTPHATVEVKGTIFRVEVAGQRRDASVTRVAVQRGVVLVHHGEGTTELGAGQTWSSERGEGEVEHAQGDEASPADDEKQNSFDGGTPSHVPPTGPVVEEPSIAPVAAPAKATKEEAPDASTLGEQNRLLERALVAEKAGDDETALRLLDALLHRYPDSPLRDSIRVARERVELNLTNGDLR